MWRKVVVAVTELALTAGIAAACGMAWTSASSGATLRSPAGISAVVSRGSAAALYPGDSVRVWVTLTNNTAQRRRIDPSAIRARVSAQPPGCLSSWFRFAADGHGQVVAARGGTATIRATLMFVDVAVDQSACSGAAPKLSLRV